MHTGSHRRAEIIAACQTSKADGHSSCTCGPDDVALRSTNFLITWPVSLIISRWCAPIYPGSVEVTHLCVKIKNGFLSWWWLLVGWSTVSFWARRSWKKTNKQVRQRSKRVNVFWTFQNLNFRIVIGIQRCAIWEADIVILLIRSLGNFWIA